VERQPDTTKADQRPPLSVQLDNVWLALPRQLTSDSRKITQIFEGMTPVAYTVSTSIVPFDDLVVPDDIDYNTLWRSDEEASHPHAP